jgi:hypothetical protein
MAQWTDLVDRAYKQTLSSEFVNALKGNVQWLRETLFTTPGDNELVIGAGWAKLAGGAHAPRIQRIGALAYTSGALTVTSGPNDLLMTVPERFIPADGKVAFAGSVVTRDGKVIECTIQPNGEVRMEAGTNYKTARPVVGDIVPVTFFWRTAAGSL